MSYKLTCYTLFDITPTGILNRNRPQDQMTPEWVYKRNTQCNFDTVIQAISLRSLPEISRNPEKMKIRFDEFNNFGFLYQQLEDEEYNCWSFDFEIQDIVVFNDGIHDLGALDSDCDRIPMILCGTEWEKLPGFLDSSDELRNIYFKITSND